MTIGPFAFHNQTFDMWIEFPPGSSREVWTVGLGLALLAVLWLLCSHSKLLPVILICLKCFGLLILKVHDWSEFDDDTVIHIVANANDASVLGLTTCDCRWCHKDVLSAVVQMQNRIAMLITDRCNNVNLVVMQNYGQSRCGVCLISNGLWTWCGSVCPWSDVIRLKRSRR